MAKPAARITDPTICPVPGHGSNTIVSGSSNVFFDGLAAARNGDACSCGSALEAAVSTTVFINGKNAALMGTLGGHGDIVIGGSSTVIIGDIHTPIPLTFVAPISSHKKWISFHIAGTESYTGLHCMAHFVDGTSLAGVFDDYNTVIFLEPSAEACQTLSFTYQAEADSQSVFDALLIATLK